MGSPRSLPPSFPPPEGSLAKSDPAHLLPARREVCQVGRRMDGQVAMLWFTGLVSVNSGTIPGDSGA